METANFLSKADKHENESVWNVILGDSGLYRLKVRRIHSHNNFRQANYLKKANSNVKKYHSKQDKF